MEERAMIPSERGPEAVAMSCGVWGGKQIWQQLQGDGRCGRRAGGVVQNISVTKSPSPGDGEYRRDGLGTAAGPGGEEPFLPYSGVRTYIL